jgi:hypothetical protein
LPIESCSMGCQHVDLTIAQSNDIDIPNSRISIIVKSVNTPSPAFLDSRSFADEFSELPLIIL